MIKKKAYDAVLKAFTTVNEFVETCIYNQQRDQGGDDYQPINNSYDINGVVYGLNDYERTLFQSPYEMCKFICHSKEITSQGFTPNQTDNITIRGVEWNIVSIDDIMGIAYLFTLSR